MKVLVTGAAGFAGGYLVEALQAADSSTIYAIAKSGDGDDRGRLKWLSCDLLDKPAVDSLILKIRPNQIYHLAAYSSPGDSYQQPVRAINETAAIQINLFEACISANINPRVLLVSSGQIYGKSSKLPLNEESAVDCNSPYAVAKLCQENLADYYAKRGFGIIIARPFNHIGPRQRLGFIVSDLANQIAMAEAAKGESIIKVGNLSSRRDFTDVRDIAAAYLKLMEKGGGAEIYNICSGKSVSGQEILDTLVSMAKCKITVEADPSKMRPSDIPELYGDHSKLTAATGWKPQIELKQTLNEVLNYWRKTI